MMLYCINFVLHVSVIGVKSNKSVNLFPTTLLITKDASKLKSHVAVTKTQKNVTQARQAWLLTCRVMAQRLSAVHKT